MKNLTLLRIDMYTLLITGPLYRLSSFILFVEVVRETMNIDKINGIVDIIGSLLVLGICFCWKHISKLFVKNSVILNIISTVLDVTMAVLLIFGLIEPIVFYCYSSVIPTMFGELNGKFYFRIKNMNLAKEEFDSLNNERSIVNTISFLLGSLLLVLFRINVTISGILYLIATSIDSIFMHIVYTKFNR